MPTHLNPPSPIRNPNSAIRISRVSVIGVTGSGKTTLAAELARRLGLPHVELDALYWMAGWKPVPREVFRQRVEQALAQPGWVCDGNYFNSLGHAPWSQADTLVWLDYPLPLVLARLVWRTLARVVRRDLLWNGNRETLTGAFFGRDSLLRLAFQQHRRHHQEVPQAAAQFPRLHLVRLRTPQQAAAFLSQI